MLKNVWRIEVVKWGSASYLKELLDNNWEPFAVTENYDSWIWLRKLIQINREVNNA